MKTDSVITAADRRGHFLARWGYRRDKHRLEPGLYALGNPTPDSAVFVTANYTLSFDALRSALAGRDAHILVLNTEGINVWCAAGKGTFGTDELVHRIEEAGLQDVVGHRRLVLPQLGAPGVSAHEVKKRTGFKVTYGPIRAADLPAYLDTGEATAEMRRMHFPLLDRAILIPVELVQVLIPMFIAAGVFFFLSGPMASAAVIAAFLAGSVLFPLLLPWLPTSEFSSKGFILGAAIALPFALISFADASAEALWLRLGWALVYMLAMPPLTAFLTLNFTGATTFTSKSAVKREIAKYIPKMAWSFGSSLVLMIAFSLVRFLGER